ncbi:MAG: hypothetical protein K0S00_3091 [Xanthobacteraceae bacterium]|jgi:hypothetical protein|nr:hypothetical protein [Xanthobacteraceae bacterium]
MCGRFSQFYTWAEIHAFSRPLVVETPSNLPPQYNIAPTDQAGVIWKGADGQWHYEVMRWGLIPRWWSRPLKGMAPMHNARAEEVDTKPALPRPAAPAHLRSRQRYSKNHGPRHTRREADSIAARPSPLEAASTPVQHRGQTRDDNALDWTRHLNSRKSISRLGSLIISKGKRDDPTVFIATNFRARWHCVP